MEGLESWLTFFVLCLLHVLQPIPGCVHDFKGRVNRLPTSTRNTFSCKSQKTHEEYLRNKDRKSGNWQPEAGTRVQKCHEGTICLAPSFCSTHWVCWDFVSWPSRHGCNMAATALYIMSTFKERRKREERSASHYLPFQSGKQKTSQMHWSRSCLLLLATIVLQGRLRSLVASKGDQGRYRWLRST